MTNHDILKEYEAHKIPVPSYEEWQAKDEENKNLYKMLDVLNGQLDSLLKEDKENAKLKEMLYKCREKLDRLDYGCEVWAGELTGFIEEIDQVIGEKK